MVEFLFRTGNIKKEQSDRLKIRLIILYSHILNNVFISNELIISILVHQCAHHNHSIKQLHLSTIRSALSRATCNKKNRRADINENTFMNVTTAKLGNGNVLLFLTSVAADEKVRA